MLVPAPLKKVAFIFSCTREMHHYFRPSVLEELEICEEAGPVMGPESLLLIKGCNGRGS
jgi:hypothetical protein